MLSKMFIVQNAALYAHNMHGSSEFILRTENIFENGNSNSFILQLSEKLTNNLKYDIQTAS